mgnify:CR=1 FL=1
MSLKNQRSNSFQDEVKGENNLILKSKTKEAQE